MNLSNRPVTSREYKLILHASQFKDLDKGVKKFWNLVKSVAKAQEGAVTKPDQDEVLERRTWYLDTEAFDLRSRFGLALRMREELSATIKEKPQKLKRKKFKVTLKYREPDRYISANRDVSFSKKVAKANKVKKKDVDTKFEEDILPPFRSILSHSTSVKLEKQPKFHSMADVVAFFPGLVDLGLPKDIAIKKVNGVKAHEWSYRVGKLSFGEEVKVCLSFWYDERRRTKAPVIAEFSFDYGVGKLTEQQILEKVLDNTLAHFPPNVLEVFPQEMFETNFPKGVLLENFPVTVAVGAKRLFAAMKDLDGVDLKGTTKTAFAYEGFK